MNDKRSLAYLILIIAPLFSAFHAPVTKEKENTVAPGASNIVLQSKDGGQTWQDISSGLPETEEPEVFFAAESDIFLRVKNVIYRSQSNLRTPVWQKVRVLDPRSTSIASNRTGLMAYHYEGQIYQQTSAAGTWLPIYSNFKKQSVRTIFEASDGTVFLGCDFGVYRSADGGRNWKQVLNGGWIELVEAEGVLIGTSQSGIIRSTDNGEHWEKVISEGGVGIAVERIDGGFAAISYNTSTQTRRIHVSWDGGKTWNAIDAGLPPSKSISSIKQIGGYLVCGHPDGIFRSSDMGKTWNIVYSNLDDMFKVTGSNSRDDGKVYKIYVSGNVLYAVATNSGC